MSGTCPSLLTTRLPGRRTVSAGVWVCHGSAHEASAMAGATHLVEHLTLRRCGSRSRQSLSELIDRLGGEVDAWTGTESMGISLRTTVDALPEALALLRDAILEPTFDQEDVELERRVIQAELELIQDDPAELVEEALLVAAWGQHPLARPVIGTPESISTLGPGELRLHHASMVEPGRVLVAAVGDLGPEDVLPHVLGLPLEKAVSFPSLPPLRWIGGHRQVVKANTDQAHARLAFPGIAVDDPAIPALMVLNRVLGVGASSRLFQRLREGEGLTYDIWSGLVLRGQGGLLEVGWASSPEVFPEVRRLVDEELSGVLRGITADEVEVAKESLARAIVMDAESSAGICSMDVAELLDRGRRFDLDLVLEEYAGVTVDQVSSLAGRILRSKDVATAVCGPASVAQLVA